MDYNINTKVYPRLKRLELIERAVEIQRETKTDLTDIIKITTNAPAEAWAVKIINENKNDKKITAYQAAENIDKNICPR